MKYSKTLIFLTLILTSCSPYWKEQEKFLLPDSYELERVETTQQGIITYNRYKVQATAKDDSLFKYPVNTMEGRGWIITNWHEPTKQELVNLKILFKQEAFRNNFLKGLETALEGAKDYLIAYAYDKDDASLDQKNYQVHNWIEFYYLNLDEKELIHISYGKF